MGSCLIVDDSRVVRESLRRVLVARGLFDEVLEAADGTEALDVLAREIAGGIDLVLCDLVMPGVDGFQLLARLQADRRLADVPVIVLTGQDDLETKVQALESGASDYLIKPFADAELVARVKVHRNLKLLREELQEANERLRELAIRDPLTGVFNRRHWRGLLLRELERCRRYRRPVSVVMADVDHFKSVNDRHGHVAGDLVLTRVARTLLEGVRHHDSVGRFGGEEFVVLLPETGIEAAAAVAERLREAVAALAFDGLEDLRVHLSLGVAEGRCTTPEEGDILVAAADEALYEAKRAGRDRVVAAGLPVAPPV